MKDKTIDNFNHTVVKALLPHIILTETANRPIHGYALITLIRRKHGIYLGPSTVYPELNELEKRGLIQSQWLAPAPKNGRPRKVYTITNKGRILLGQTRSVLTFVNKTMIIEVKT